MVTTVLPSPVRVRDVLAAALPGLRDHMLEEAIRKEWRQVVGRELSRCSRPGGLRMGVLDVTVDNSPWLHELTLRASELLAPLRARYGSAVTSLRFTLGIVAAGPSPVMRRR